VIVTEAWPSAAETVPMFTPAAIAIDAKVWRHSCRVIRSSPAAPPCRVGGLAKKRELLTLARELDELISRF
jgi:hypothetical protein